MPAVAGHQLEVYRVVVQLAGVQPLDAFVLRLKPELQRRNVPLPFIAVSFNPRLRWPILTSKAGNSHSYLQETISNVYVLRTVW